MEDGLTVDHGGLTVDHGWLDHGEWSDSGSRVVRLWRMV